MVRTTRDLTLANSAIEKLNSKSLRLPEVLPNADWRVFRLQQFINGKDSRWGLRLADACREMDLGVSAPYAARLFRQHVGLSIREYTKRKRLYSALMYLETTSLSIKEIASTVGYNTQSDFFRQFKQLFHETPSHYREKSRTEIFGKREVGAGANDVLPHDA